MPTRRTVLTTLAAAGLGGCTLPGMQTETPERAPATVGTVRRPGGMGYRYTHARVTGNRTLAGAGDVRGADPVTFEPPGQPQWLVAHPADTGSVWTVVNADGRGSRWRVADGEAARVADYDPLPAETQPVVATGGANGPQLLRPPADMASRTSPLVVPGGDSERVCYVADGGDLVVAGDERARLAVDALVDGRLAALGDGRVALFTDPTDRYAHGALGDTTEGTTLTVVDTERPAVDWRASVDAPVVFEGLQPLVADLDGDGAPEVVTTVADSVQGARVAVFSAGGERLATGPTHSRGWRHQLAVAPFGPDGHAELAVVRKPHVDRVLEFYRLGGGSLSITATADGVSTHTYGSRILDGGVAGDIDGDGRVEVLVPTAERTALVAVRRTADGAGVAWRQPLDGPVQSNVTGIGLADGIAVGAGTGGTVTVWQG